MKKSIFLLFALLTPVLVVAEGQLINLSTGAEMTVYLPDADKVVLLLIVLGEAIAIFQWIMKVIIGLRFITI